MQLVKNVAVKNSSAKAPILILLFEWEACKRSTGLHRSCSTEFLMYKSATQEVIP